MRGERVRITDGAGYEAFPDTFPWISDLSSNDPHCPDLSHHADSDVSFKIREHYNESGPGGGQRRPSDNLPQQVMVFFRTPDAEWINIQIESHR
jgi:hypothetical protein